MSEWQALDAAAGRSPCGERGLKLLAALAAAGWLWSLPVRGAWVEIVKSIAWRSLYLSLPVRGAWVEIRKRALLF